MDISLSRIVIQKMPSRKWAFGSNHVPFSFTLDGSSVEVQSLGTMLFPQGWITSPGALRDQTLLRQGEQSSPQWLTAHYFMPAMALCHWVL